MGSRGFVPLVHVTLYVDDLTLEFFDKSRGVVTWMLAAATDHVVEHFEKRLGLEVSAKKSVAIAGRPGIAAGIAVLARTRKLTAQRSGKLLGVASAGGRRRAVAVLKGRLKQLDQRIPSHSRVAPCWPSGCQAGAGRGDASSHIRHRCHGHERLTPLHC